jgi:hypothetical protein
MRKFLRRHLGVMVVAMVTAMATAGAPALAHGVQHALFAHNSDKVDGKHAVSSGATVNNRKGKLVATSATTGRLPNNIIATGQLVAAGIHTVRATTLAEPTIDESFNNVNPATPSISGSGGTYLIDMGFATSNKFALCGIDTNYVDTRDALCTVSIPGGNTVRVRIWDTATQDDTAGFRNAEFWVIVYGR